MRPGSAYIKVPDQHIQPVEDYSDHDDDVVSLRKCSQDDKPLGSHDDQDPKIIGSKGGYGKPQSKEVVEQEIQQPIFKTEVAFRDVIKPKAHPLEVKEISENLMPPPASMHISFK